MTLKGKSQRFGRPVLLANNASAWSQFNQDTPDPDIPICVLCGPLRFLRLILLSFASNRAISAMTETGPDYAAC
jgi:hypothetical protein